MYRGLGGYDFGTLNRRRNDAAVENAAVASLEERPCLMLTWRKQNWQHHARRHPLEERPLHRLRLIPQVHFCLRIASHIVSRIRLRKLAKLKKK